MNYIVYQAYGHKDILNECCYSIISLLKHHHNNDLKIVIYTDNKNHFSFLPTDNIDFIKLNETSIQDYKGPFNFVHRVKIKVLEDFCKKYQGKFIYVDTDIFFLKNISPLFNRITDNQFLMCNNEGPITNKKNRVFVKFKNYIDLNKNYLNNHHIPIPSNIQMWNAGVLGMKTTHDSIIEQVLYTNDTIYPQFHSHIVEQMSFTYQLQKEGNIEASTDYLFHYWNFKEFRSVLSTYFEYHINHHSSFEKLLDTIDQIRPDKLIRPKLEYEQLPFILKTLRKIKGKKHRWKFPHYTIV
jgi:lipopolysaccharide biosynthesis glycosyltransferase